MLLYENSISSSFQKVHETVKEIMEQLKLIDDVDRQFLLFRINFMLREVLNNAVEHGNAFDEDKMVGITITYEKPHLRFVITDQGQGIELPKHDLGHAEYILRERSRGIEMIRKFQFELQAEGNTLHVHLNLDHVKEEI